MEIIACFRPNTVPLLSVNPFFNITMKRLLVFILAAMIAAQAGATQRPYRVPDPMYNFGPVAIGLVLATLDIAIHRSEPVSAPPRIFTDSLGFVSVRVMAVHDADSWKVKFPGGRQEWVRGVGFDAPEVFSPYVLREQPYGADAATIARNELKGRTILIDTLAVSPNRDQYGRLLVEAYAQDRLVSLSFVSRGLAWYVPVKGRKVPGINAILKRAQKEARFNKLGVFQKKRPVRPETWRRRWSPNQL